MAKGSQQVRAWRAHDEEKGSRFADRRARLAALVPASMDDPVLSSERVVALLERALRRERAHVGRPSYDLTRHAAVAQALREERARVERQRRRGR